MSDDASLFAEALRAQRLEEAQDSELAEELSRRGWIVHSSDRAHPRIELDDPDHTGSVRIGVVSDTHLGSKYQQLTLWRSFAQVMAEAKVDYVLHLGDALDGSFRMHRGMELEQHTWGYEGQVRYAVNNWPEVKVGRRLVTQYAIGGNHEYSFAKDTGAFATEDIARQREDIVALGGPHATLTLGGVDLYLLHPDGGVAYARSYKLQKLVEQMPSGDKPHVLLTGHWHLPAHVPGYRNVEAISVPAFQSQTPYLRRKGLAPQVGGLILDLDYSPRGLEDLTTRWCLYRTPIEKDY